jgi:hypothetical protein
MEECIDRLVDGQEIANARSENVEQDNMSWQGGAWMYWQMRANPFHGVYENETNYVKGFAEIAATRISPL